MRQTDDDGIIVAVVRDVVNIIVIVIDTIQEGWWATWHSGKNVGLGWRALPVPRSTFS